MFSWFNNYFCEQVKIRSSPIATQDFIVPSIYCNLIWPHCIIGLKILDRTLIKMNFMSRQAMCIYLNPPYRDYKIIGHEPNRNSNHKWQIVIRWSSQPCVYMHSGPQTNSAILSYLPFHATWHKSMVLSLAPVEVHLLQPQGWEFDPHCLETIINKMGLACSCKTLKES